MTARRALYYHERLAQLDPDYLDCPDGCGESCADCPVVELERDFFEAAQREIGREYDARQIYRDVCLASRLRPRTTLERVMRDIIEQEKARKRLIEEWNREQERKRGG